MAVKFYRLAGEPVVVAAAPLLEAALARGLRTVVRCGPGLGVEALDAMLWSYDADSFLPHGRVGEPHAARQPVLLTEGGEAANAPDCLMLVGGARAADAEFAAFERVQLVFDGEDPAALEAARGEWRRVRALGVPAEFWERRGGRWEKVAASGEGGEGAR